MWPTQIFREYGKCIFEDKRVKPKQAGDSQEEALGGRHVTRAKSWWKRGDVDACAAQTNMQCWVHQDILFNDEHGREQNERNQGKQAHPVSKYRVPHGSQPRHGWAPDPPMVGIRSPIGLVVGSCTSHPGVLGSIPKREELGKTGAPCV
jgi:hypothetical protein